MAFEIADLSRVFATRARRKDGPSIPTSWNSPPPPVPFPCRLHNSFRAVASESVRLRAAQIDGARALSFSFGLTELVDIEIASAFPADYAVSHRR